MNRETEIKAKGDFVPSSCGHGEKRKPGEYISWEEFFMGAALLAAMRSKDPNTQVGACIVNDDNKIVGIGYNGMPFGCSDDEFPWSKSPVTFDSKQSYVCHAEMNAVLNKNEANIKNCRIYVSLFPCNECAKIIIQSGIKEVVYLNKVPKKESLTKTVERMFDAAGVKSRQFNVEKTTISIHFGSSEPTQILNKIDERTASLVIRQENNSIP